MWKGEYKTTTDVPAEKLFRVISNVQQLEQVG